MTTNYIVNQEDLACPPPDIQTPPVGIVIDDGYSQVINIGFTFCYYGNMYDQLVVNDNGFITFDLTTANIHDGNSYTIPATPIPYLPTPQEQTNAIYACWMDTFTPAATSPELAIQFRLVNQDQPGNRIFIIDWKDVPMYGNTSEILSASLYLYETSNVIETNIYEVGSSSTNNGRGLVGIQNKSGTRGFSAPGRDTGTWPASFNGTEKWRFFPNGDTLDYSFQWYVDLNHDGEFLEEDGECLYCDLAQEDVPSFIEVRPEVETEYQAILTYQGECSFDPVPPTIEITSVLPRPDSPILHEPNNQYTCETSLDTDLSIFNLTEENPLQDFLDNGYTQTELENLFEIIYYYEEDTDGDNIFDNVIEITGDTVDEDGNTIPLIEYYSSKNKTIHVLTVLNCDKDFDGDGISNCEDPFPEIACDSSDPNEDCDGDGLNNGIDTEPLVYGPCDQDYDGDGMFDCADPNPDSFCNVNDPNGDCDGDGIKNSDDAEPLISNFCEETNPNGDCDNDGISNSNDADIVCDINDCDLDCDGDGIKNCLDILPQREFNNCDGAELIFDLNVLEIEDTFFEYNTPFCTNFDTTTDDLLAEPQSLPTYNDPSNIVHLYEIDNGGVWENPLTSDITQSIDGIINIDESAKGDDNTGDFNITHTITSSFEVTYNDLSNETITCDNSYTTSIHIDLGQNATFVYPEVACKEDIDFPKASDYFGSTDFTISVGGVLSNPSTGEIDLDLTPVGTYTIYHDMVAPCPESDSHIITIYDSTFNYPNDDILFCNDDSINPISDISNGEYSIDNGGVLVDNTTGEINLSDSGLGNDGTGVFTVTHTIDNNCPFELEITIEITEDASFDFPSEICIYENNPEAFDIEVSGGTFSVDNLATIDQNGVLDLSTTTEGEAYEIKYELNTTGHCPSFSTKTIFINETPVANAPTTLLTECNNGDGTADFDVLSLEDEILGNQNGMLLSFYLNEQEAKDDVNAVNTNPTLRVNANIWARVENSSGCYDVVEIPLFIDECYAVLPQAFSPNSNIVENQTLNIKGLIEIYPDFEISIFNRFGQLVYNGNSSTDNWNGKLNNEGEILPVGTYFYILNLNEDQELKYRGWVYLQE